MDSATAAPLAPKWQPHHFGPLAGETPISTGSVRLFDGEESILTRRQIEARIRFRDSVAGRLSTVLQEDETILYLAPAIELGRFLDRAGVGWLWARYFHVALVFTDQRLIEVLMENYGKQPSTRVRSFPWGQIKDFRLVFGGIRVKPRQGRAVSWRLRVRRDKRVVRPLLDQIRERCLGLSGTGEVETPLWHCPTCGTAYQALPETCGSCRTSFRTKKMASLLALAFPGAGLFYAGRPVLATFDFFGELFLYILAAVGVLVAGNGEELGFAIFLGAFFLGMTKLESVHLSRILVHRSRPLSEELRGRWRTAAMTLGALSLVAVLLPFAGVGALAEETAEGALEAVAEEAPIQEPAGGS